MLTAPSRDQTIVAIFAKYPRPGHVKTRLANGPLGDSPPLSLQACADLYRAFLQDYIHRFSQPDLSAFPCYFCVRPGPDTPRFVREFTTPHIQHLEEPTYQGQPAQHIGQAISFTIRALLSQGADKVLILGSDLPHFPTDILTEARDLLDHTPLVLGDDGGGCYLIGASEPPKVLETGDIPWSQGRDFVAIQAAQQALGRQVSTLSKKLEDIDHPDALLRLIQALKRGDVPATRIPHTVALLQRWGL